MKTRSENSHGRKKNVYAFIAKSVGRAWAVAAFFAVSSAVPPSSLSAAPAPAPAVAPEDQPGQFLPGDLRKLAVFASDVPLAANFVERGAPQVAAFSPDRLVGAPPATHL